MTLSRIRSNVRFNSNAPEYSAFKKAAFNGGVNGSSISETDLSLSFANAEYTNDITGPFGDSITGKLKIVAGNTNYGGGFSSVSGKVTATGSSIWLRKYIYMPTAFCAGYGTLGDGYGSTKWFRLGYTSSGQRITLQFSNFAASSCSATTLEFDHVSLEVDSGEVVVTFPTAAVITRDNWNAIQFQVGLDSSNSGFIRAWLGETYLGEVTGLHTLPNSDDILDNIVIGDYWNGEAYQTTEWYFDEIIITTETPNTTDSGGRPYISPSTRVISV